MLPTMLTAVSDLGRGLTRERLSVALVDLLAGRSHHRVRGAGLDGFFAMTALNIGIVGLAAGFIVCVCWEGFVCRCGAGGEGLGVEFRGEVLRSDFATKLVLFYVRFFYLNTMKLWTYASMLLGLS